MADLMSVGIEVEEVQEPRARRHPATLGPPPAAVVVGAIALGVVLRLLILRSSMGALDSDEAVVGLMARRFELGHFRAFFWGEPYGGTLETTMAAALFKVFGATPTVLKSVPMLLNAASALLVWRIGRRVTTRGAAVVAGMLVWLWPANYLWWSTKARGFYEASLLLGLGVVLVALRLGQGADVGRWHQWMLLGLLGGLGWWQSPLLAYSLVPASAWLVSRRRWATWRAVWAVPAFALGALPWVVASVKDGLASLHPPPSPVAGSYIDHLWVLAHQGMPMTLGLKIVYSSRWIGAAPWATVLYWVALALVAYACVMRWPGGRLVVALLVAFPFLHALLSLSGSVAEGRYTLLALPWLALAMAHGATRRATAALLVAVCVTVTLVGLRDMRDRTTPFFSARRIPASFAPLERALAERGVTRAWSNYWVAYRITFETHEHVIAAPTTSDRYPRFAAEVSAASPPAAHVFLAHTVAESDFHAGLTARGIRFERWPVGRVWVVYLPRRKVAPTAIAGSYP